jgi:hypothetical protein
MQGYALARPEIVPRTFDDRFPEPELTQVGDQVRPYYETTPRVPSQHVAPASDFTPRPPLARRATSFGKRTR